VLFAVANVFVLFLFVKASSFLKEECWEDFKLLLSLSFLSAPVVERFLR